MNSVALPASAPSSPLSAEADLVRQAARGDAESFGELYRRHCQPAWRLAQAVAPDRDRAVAAFREGLLRAVRTHRSSKRGAEAPAFRTDVLAGVYRAAVENIAAQPPVGSRANAADPDAALADAAFRSLPERWRAAVWLTEVENLDTQAVAAVLGVSTAVATQLILRGRRGLGARYSQARREAPNHFGEALRPVALAMPASLAEATQARWAAAGAERAPVLAPAGVWMEQHAARPLSLATVVLIGLGLVGLGVVPQSSSMRQQQLSASGALHNPAGALPADTTTCLGLPCPTGTAGAASYGSLNARLRTNASAGAVGMTGSAGGASDAPGAASSLASAQSAATGAAPGGVANGAIPGGQAGAAPGAGAPVPGHPGSGQPGSSGGGSSSAGGTTTLVALLPVAAVTQSGRTLGVNLLPSANTSLVSVTVGCNSLVGASVAGTTVGCPSPTAPAVKTTTAAPKAPAVAPVVSTVTGAVTGITNAVPGATTAPGATTPATSTATSGATGTVANTTGTVTNTVPGATNTAPGATNTVTGTVTGATNTLTGTVTGLLPGGH